jgi:transcriptional regulator with XRE-family HTH domain
MTRHSYRERDYAFGQAMLSLRTRLGLTQAGLAGLLQISRHAVGEWEAGLNYPKAHHLQHFVACASLRLRTGTGGRGDPHLVENGPSTGVPR